MATDDSAKERSENLLDSLVGISVVFLATFLGICNVKDGNVVQQMQLKQGERNNLWAWYQARNIRVAVYEGTSEELGVPLPGESAEIKLRAKSKTTDSGPRETTLTATADGGPWFATVRSTLPDPELTAEPVCFG